MDGAWSGCNHSGIAGERDDRNVHFVGHGLSSLPPGETLYTDFSSVLPSGATGDGSLYGPNYGTKCFGSNCVAAPDTNSGLTTGQFFAVTSRENPKPSPSVMLRRT